MPPLDNAREERLAQLLFCKPTGKTDGECYIEAGYDVKNLETAAANVCKKLKNSKNLRDRIQELKQEMADKSVMDTAKIVEAISPIATSDMMAFLERRGGWYTLKSHEDLERLDTRAIKDIKMSTRIIKKDGEEQIVDQIVEIKLHDKNKTADILMKWSGGYEQDNRQKSEVIVVAPSAEGE